MSVREGTHSAAHPAPRSEESVPLSLSDATVTSFLPLGAGCGQGEALSGETCRAGSKQSLHLSVCSTRIQYPPPIGC